MRFSTSGFDLVDTGDKMFINSMTPAIDLSPITTTPVIINRGKNDTGDN